MINFIYRFPKILYKWKLNLRSISKYFFTLRRIFNLPRLPAAAPECKPKLLWSVDIVFDRLIFTIINYNGLIVEA